VNFGRLLFGFLIDWGVYLDLLGWQDVYGGVAGLAKPWRP
jgi:hypothetical protein